jgi:hypothetical protein
MEKCPRCKSHRVAVGKLHASRGRVVFRPGKLRTFALTLLGGVPLGDWNPLGRSDAPANGCLDCGFLWGQLDQVKLKDFIRSHCNEETRRECDLTDGGG